MAPAKTKLKNVENNETASSGQARIKILCSARVLFSKKGFNGTSTQEITDHAGVNKRLLFYYFKSKEELYLVTLEDFFSELERFLENFCVTPADLQDPWLSLLAFSDNFIHFVSRHMEPLRILIREIMDEGPFLDTLTERYVRPIFEAGEQYLGHLVPGGGENNREIQHLLLSIGGANILYFLMTPVLERLWEDDPVSKGALEERKKVLRRFILRSL